MVNSLVVLNLEHKSARAMYRKTGGRRSEPGNKLDDVNISECEPIRGASQGEETCWLASFSDLPTSSFDHLQYLKTRGWESPGTRLMLKASCDYCSCMGVSRWGYRLK